jgi:hypothetical protein
VLFAIILTFCFESPKQAGIEFAAWLRWRRFLPGSQIKMNRKKLHSTLRRLCVAACAVFCVTETTLLAQSRAATRTAPAAVRAETAVDALGPGEAIRIRRIEGVGKMGLIKSPEFRSNIQAGIKRPGDWVEIKVQYDTGPDWIDELVFQYYGLAHTRENGKEVYSLYQATVRYSDIERGHGHLGTAYLCPNTVKRYGLLVAVAVEISYNGKVIDAKSVSDGTVKQTDWWKNPAVTGSGVVVPRPGYLLNRRESPFALINMDDYEVIK